MKHLDEGTIHAWLDGELPDDVRDIERHVAECAECAARVAEARGLIAGASRILSALDDVGDGIVPARAPEVERPTRRRLVRTVSWLAAAGVVFAVGVETVKRTPDVPVKPAPVETLKVAAPPVESLKVAVPAPVSAKTDTPRVEQPRKVAANAPRAAVAGASAAAAAAPPTVTGQANAKSAVGASAAGAGVAGGRADAVLPPPALDSVAGLRRQIGGGEMHLNAIVATSSAREAQARDVVAAEGLGRVPLCFVAGARATMADANVPAGWPRVGRMMLDTTVVAGASGSTEFRVLRDSSGVMGEWARVGADSVMLRIAGTVRLGVVVAAGDLRVGETVLVRTECGGGGGGKGR